MTNIVDFPSDDLAMKRAQTIAEYYAQTKQSITIEQPVEAYQLVIGLVNMGAVQTRQDMLPNAVQRFIARVFLGMRWVRV